MWDILFEYQSQDISFGDWITLLTLCLAPLIAHIVAGVPAPVYLHSKRPNWHDRICHYNPTSILWRYLAIVDRRIRAKSWTSIDMAASNAIFWDGYKWDGSEAMIQRSRDFCIRRPTHHHIEPISKTMIVTLVVTLQGGQALFSIISGTVHNRNYSATISLSTIFFPLATLGLLRLPAAFWLTEDYVYRHNEDWTPDSPQIEYRPNVGRRGMGSNSALVIQPTISSLESPIVLDRFHAHSWQSATIKAFFLLMVVGLFFLCIYELVGGFGDFSQVLTFTATNLCLNLTLLFFLTVTIGTVVTYVWLDGCKTTIVPCITATWYKMYTGILFAAMLTVLIVAALETRRTPCGLYTTYPVTSSFDYALCGNSMYITKAMEPNTNSTLGSAHQNGTELPHKSILFNETYGIAFGASSGNIAVVAFDGWCKFDSKITPDDVAMFEPMNFTSAA